MKVPELSPFGRDREAECRRSMPIIRLVPTGRRIDAFEASRGRSSKVPLAELPPSTFNDDVGAAFVARVKAAIRAE